MTGYATALGVAEKFRQLIDQQERMSFWDAHSNVFGEVSAIVFDTQENKYGPYHGRSQQNLFTDLRGDIDRYKAYWVFPNDVEEFVPFMDWCLAKFRNTEGFTIMDEDYYWKRIGQSQFPEDFLSRLLTAAEAHRNQISEVRNAFVCNSLTDAEAKDCFFFYGNRDYTEGEMEGIFGTQAAMYLVFQAMQTRPLPDYGRIFFHYYDGYHTASMVKFLRQQQRRLERGENIVFSYSESPRSANPAPDEQPDPPGTVEETALPENPEQASKGKKPAARPFAHFVDKLTNGFTERDLNGLLVHMNVKNNEGETLRFVKYIMHSIVDALITEEYYEKGNREIDQKALAQYLGLEYTKRTKRGYGDKEPSARCKAEIYLKKLKKEREKNGSNLVP